LGGTKGPRGGGGEIDSKPADLVVGGHWEQWGGKMREGQIGLDVVCAGWILALSKGGEKNFKSRSKSP